MQCPPDLTIRAISSLHLAQYSARPAVPPCFGVYLRKHCSTEYGGSYKTPSTELSSSDLRNSSASILYFAPPPSILMVNFAGLFSPSKWSAHTVSSSIYLSILSFLDINLY